MILTVAAVACGVALVCAIELVNRAIYAAFIDILDTMAGRTALHVTAGDGALIPEETATTVGTLPGVELAVPVVSSWAFTTDGTGEQLTVHGIDLANDDAIRVYEPAGSSPELDDPLVFLNRRDSVILTEAFAARRALSIGSPIELDTPTGRGRFTVRGLLAPKGIARAQGGNLLVMDIMAAELAFTQRGLVNRVDVVVRHDSDVPSVRDAIIASLTPGIRVEVPEQRRIDLQRVMRSVQSLLRAVGLFGIAAAFLIVFSRMSSMFEARVAQLALLRAVGVRIGQVWWELLKEGALIGLAGVAVGIPVGIALGHVLLPSIATTTAIGAKLVSTDAQVTVRLESVAQASILGLSAVLLAALLPARRAAGVAIIDTLRSHHIETEGDILPRRGVVAVVVLTIASMIGHLMSGTAETGLAATALLTVAVALLARTILGGLAPMLQWLGPAMGGAAGRYAVGSLLRAPRRTALTVATVGIGFGAVLWMWTLGRSFELSINEVMPGVLRGDLAVSSPNIGAGYVEAPLDDAILVDLAATPGVQAVVGEQTADWHYDGGPIALNAFDSPYFGTTTFGGWPLAGRALPNAGAVVARGEGVLVSENFVHNVGPAVGDLLTLDTPSGPVSLRIVGMTRDFLSPRGTVLLSRDLYRRLWRDSHITRALVKVAPSVDFDTVRGGIASTVGLRYHVRIQRLDELVDWIAEQVRQAFKGLDVLAALVLVVVLVGVGDTLAIGILERTRELGIVRAVGVRRRVLARIVVWEALALGALGVVVAIGFGLGLGIFWVTSTFPALLGWTLSLHVPVEEVLRLTVAAIATCLVAAYLPAVRLARLDPVQALRTE